MLTLESRCILVVGGSVLVAGTQRLVNEVKEVLYLSVYLIEH